jgi:hypothetical protein
MPPSTAINRIPTIVKFLKWSGRRASSAPFSALVDAAMRSMVVKRAPHHPIGVMRANGSRGTIARGVERRPHPVSNVLVSLVP